MDWTIIGWIISAIFVAGGLTGTVLPALPGVPLVFAGLFAAAWTESFNYIGTWTLVILAALTVAAVLIDTIAGALGAKKAGASPRAFWGATVGAIVGIFFGIPGMLLGPFIGAVVAEISAGRRWHQAGKAGVGTWIGMIVGTAANLAIAFLMLGIFLFQRVF
jgi:uncharacterized protein YqgC (DUF456 family)